MKKKKKYLNNFFHNIEKVLFDIKRESEEYLMCEKSYFKKRLKKIN